MYANLSMRYGFTVLRGLCYLLLTVFFIGSPISDAANLNITPNPLAGTWGYGRLKHDNTGKWSTEGGKITYNSNGTGTSTFRYNNNGVKGNGTENFSYSVIPNSDGSITVTYTYPDSTTKVRKYVLSDDGKTLLMDGTDLLDRQRLRTAVKLDTAKTYTNNDMTGNYYQMYYGYEWGKGPTYFVGSSSDVIFTAGGDWNGSFTENQAGTMWSGSSNSTFTVNPDGSIVVTSAEGYLSGDGKIGTSSELKGGYGMWMYMEKGDMVYSTSDLAGTWALAGFGDDNGNSFNAEFGFMTCDASGSCTVSIKNQRDGNVSLETFTISLSVAGDGSFGTSLGDLAPYYAGAIGNNGNNIMFNVSFESTSLYHREVFVGARCSKCSNLSPFPIAATGSKEISRGMAFDGANYLVGFQDTLVQPYISAQIVSQSGTLVGPQITLNRTGGSPILAFDGTNYLMVWEDDTTSPPNRDVYGQLISKSGTLIGSSFPICTAAGNQGPDAIVFDGTNYLVVWTDERSSMNSDIYGQFVTPAGALLGSEIPIVTGAEDQRLPGLAFDGTNYLVAWQGRHGGWDIQGRFVSKSGTLSAPFTISENPSRSYNPVSIAFDGTNYLVVWNRDIGLGYPNPTIWDIYGRIVSPAGTFPGNEFPITTSPGDQWFPFIAFDGSNYLVTWSDGRNDLNDNGICDAGEGSCVDIYGQYVSKSGVLAGPEVSIITDAGNQFVSPVLFDGERHFIVWNNVETFDGPVGDVYGQFIMKNVFEDYDPAITYTGTWKNYTCPSCSAGVMKYSGQTGAKADFSFNGTGIKWIVTKANLLGKARVYLDGVNMGLVDLYSPTPKYKVVLAKAGLTPGNHTITIEVSGQKNPASAGSLIDIDAFEVVP